MGVRVGPLAFDGLTFSPCCLSSVRVRAQAFVNSFLTHTSNWIPHPELLYTRIQSKVLTPKCLRLKLPLISCAPLHSYKKATD